MHVCIMCIYTLYIRIYVVSVMLYMYRSLNHILGNQEMLLLTFQSGLVQELFIHCKLYANIIITTPVTHVITLSVPLSSFSFSISPVNDINFGAVILNSKKSRSFVIENKGEFEFRYAITKLTQDKQRYVIKKLISDDNEYFNSANLKILVIQELNLVMGKHPLSCCRRALELLKQSLITT